MTPGPDEHSPTHDEESAGDSDKASVDAAVSGRHTRKKIDQTTDDTDEGWGEAGDDDVSARWLRENRPPHWD